MTKPAAPLGFENWQPQWGSQTLFLACPHFEALYEGTRGPGKTDALLMDFAQHVFKGFGPHWRGVLFRESYPQLADVVHRGKLWFCAKMGATYNSQSHTFTFPEGEQLVLRHMMDPADYWQTMHGQQYPWVGWEELANWPTDDCYEVVKTCCRSTYPGMPRKYRATCNPYGVGHHWLKQRFIDPAPRGTPIPTIVTDPIDGTQRTFSRVAIHGSIWENEYILRNDPQYLANLLAITDPNLRKAWLEGSWDITAGGMLDDVWRENIHVIEPFAIPKGWRINRSFDWGSSSPFAIIWWAESDGTEIRTNDGTLTYPRGTLFAVAEWYGWNGRANEGSRMLASDIAIKLRQKERAMFGNRIVLGGPADTQIFDIQNGNCIADDMGRCQVSWEKADKSPGSRELGWQKLREMLVASTRWPMEFPGIFFFQTCRQCIRTVPTLPRNPKNMEDTDPRAEDHLADAIRYRIFTRRNVMRSVENRFL